MVSITEIAKQMFVVDHVAEFRACYPQPPVLASGETKEGKSPSAWFKGIDKTRLDHSIGELPSSVNRSKLLEMARDVTVDTPALCVSIFAWGGMHGANRTRLFEKPLAPWLKLAEKVRGGELVRSEAYDAFAGLRQRGKASSMSGMGPAYFTKLLYFLAPSSPAAPKGYIMDQWLGCAINLLMGRPVVRLDHQSTWVVRKRAPVSRIDSRVSDLNSGREYEEFCRCVEKLSEEMGAGWTPELAERALIADGGRKPRPWRTYVVEQRLALIGRM